MQALLQHHQSGATYPLEDYNLLGRSEDASICLRDASVSRAHAVIRKQGNSFWVQDLGSANGTMVNEMFVTTAQKLIDGDVIHCGQAELVFQSPDTLTSLITGGHPEEGERTQVLRRDDRAVRTTEATLLVGDLTEFTNLSHRLGAEDLAELVTRWYESCRSILLERGAHIDKFIGDCVFAYWPEASVESRLLALESARLLRSSRVDDSHTRKLIMEKASITFDCRVGLHVGHVAFGGAYGGSYTVLGDAANLTFRVESMTRKLQAGILATPAFIEGFDEAKNWFVSRGFQKIRGLPDSLEIFAFNEPGLLPNPSA